MGWRCSITRSSVVHHRAGTRRDNRRRRRDLGSDRQKLERPPPFFFTSSSASFSRFIDFPFLVSRNFIVRQRIPSHSTGFYWVLPSFTELYWILPCFHLVLTGFTGFYEVLEWLPSSKGLTPNISSIGSEKWELTIGVGRNRFSKPIGSLR